MPPANVSGECVWGFIVGMYIECTFQFIEALLTDYPELERRVFQIKRKSK